MAEYILSIDQGTTTTRALIIDRRGNYINTATQTFEQKMSQSGWVEQDPNIIWQSVSDVIRKVMKHSEVSFTQIKALGITNQRETTVIWDRKTGQPIHNAIVWNSNQSLTIIEQLEKEKIEDSIRKKTGLVLSPYFSASKIRWILDHHPGSQERAERGELAFGTVDSWLIWNLTNGKLHTTDHTNASRTMLFNIHTLEWDDQLLKIFNIPKTMLPKVYPSSYIYGLTDIDLFNGINIPIAGVAGNQQAALFGQLAFEPGQLKSTYGQGTFIVMNTGSEPKLSKHNLLTTIAYSTDKKIIYALEGSALISGSAIEWLKDGLNLFNSIDDSELLALEADINSSVYVVPTFRGIGAPYWDPNARGAILGINESTSRRELVRATLESIAYQVTDIIELMELDTGITVDLLYVDGGAAQNNMLIQFQADILGKTVRRIERLDTTGLGAAYLAGLAVGYWCDQNELTVLVSENEKFEPLMADNERQEKLNGWHRAVKAVRYYAKLLHE
ncbi:glycerol kinase GlpK (plasmid) [Jeotgalibaca sp. MA1X17-3]|uniref:glycerol kinase GlpK n=1 Tax=Jeotgalibaca sp. MA1X17-3 TaxID=2908211 RepID=UPI001F31DB9E|nr:glycerol kinase GlpK [Jeotgalibaca sp. MA1X17-3]UJF16761.1 glycerol kinase GlpK [Jeotgalibaca sp. MA1X17-3]